MTTMTRNTHFEKRPKNEFHKPIPAKSWPLTTARRPLLFDTKDRSFKKSNGNTTIQERVAQLNEGWRRLQQPTIQSPKGIVLLINKQNQWNPSLIDRMGRFSRNPESINSTRVQQGRFNTYTEANKPTNNGRSDSTIYLLICLEGGMDDFPRELT